MDINTVTQTPSPPVPRVHQEDRRPSPPRVAGHAGPAIPQPSLLGRILSQTEFGSIYQKSDKLVAAVAETVIDTTGDVFDAFIHHSLPDQQTDLHNTFLRALTLEPVAVQERIRAHKKAIYSGAFGPLLSAAVHFGTHRLVKTLLNVPGTDPDANSAGVDTPLFQAIFKGDADIATELLEWGADPDANSEGITTPLFQAVENGNIPLVTILFQYGANADANSQGEHTPLACAVTQKDAIMTERLLQHGACPNANNGGITPLFLAASHGYLKISKILLARNACVNGDSQGNPLTIATEKGFPDIIKLLLEQGACPDALHQSQETPLGIICRKGWVEIGKILLAHNASLNRNSPELPSLLTQAACHGRLAIFMLLLDAGALPAAETIVGARPIDFQKTVLHRAVIHSDQKKSQEMVAALLAKGARFHYPDRPWNEQPLHFAIAMKHPVVINQLLTTGASLNGSSDQERQTIEELLPDADPNQYCAGPEQPAAGGAERKMALEAQLRYAISSGDDIRLRLLLANSKCDPDNFGSGENSLLCLAIKRQFLPAVAALLEAKADPNGRECPQYGLFHTFARSLPLVKGWQITKSHHHTGAGGQCPLFHAVSSGYLPMVRCLCEAGARPDGNSTKDATPLARAVSMNNPAMVEYLLKQGASPDGNTIGPKTPLAIAAATGLLRILELLLQAGADPDANSYGVETPLYIASSHGFTRGVAALLKLDQKSRAWADPDARDQGGNTPLFIAAKNGFYTICQHLINAGADLRGNAIGQETPLLQAISYGHLKIVELLVQKHDSDTGLYAYISADSKAQPLLRALTLNNDPVMALNMVKTLLGQKMPYSEPGLAANLPPILYSFATTSLANALNRKDEYVMATFDMLNTQQQHSRSVESTSGEIVDANPKEQINTLMYWITHQRRQELWLEETDEVTLMTWQNSPLHFAIIRQDPAIISELIHKGANLRGIQQKEYDNLMGTLAGVEYTLVRLLINNTLREMELAKETTRD